MKKFLLAILIMVASLPAVSQDIFDSGDNKPYFGARLGLDISCPGGWKVNKMSLDLYDSGAGFDLGAVYNIPLWKNLYFEPGLSIYYNTQGYDIGVSGDDSELVDADASLRRFGFRIPFQVGYRFDFNPVKLYFATGPVLSVALVGKDYLKNNITGETSSVSCFDNLNRVDLGWKFALGAIYDRYLFQLSVTPGMLDMAKSDNVSYHDCNVALTLGYNF